jgi:hypothetical protein
MGLGHGYGHAGALLELHGQEKRKATLAKKKREKECEEFDPHRWIDGDLAYDPKAYKGILRYMCPACGGTSRSDKPHVHIHPEDNEAFEVKLHGLLWQPVGIATDYPESKKKGTK